MRRHGVFEVGYVFHGNYRVVRVLGRGGMGTVLEVEHTRLPRRLALKVMTSPVSTASEDMLRFRREAETLASLNHPNLVVVFDWNVTEDEHLPYLVMELLTGEDLAHVLKRCGALSQQVAISIMAQAINALEVVHSHGIVHRDLKPANLFVCKNGVIPHFIKVLDFGIAKSNQPNSPLVTNNLVLMGTPAYMAPEQARGDLGPVGPRTDQFALGLMLYEMLSGCPAFYRPREPAMTTLFRVMHEEPKPLPDAAMNAAVMRALRKHPDERYQSLPEFLRAVLAAASVPADAIEVPERTEKVGIRSVGAAGPVADVASPEPAGEGRSRAGARGSYERSESLIRPGPSASVVAPIRSQRDGRSALAALPSATGPSSVPVIPVPSSVPASLRRPATDPSSSRSASLSGASLSGASLSGTSIHGGTGRATAAVGQALSAESSPRSLWRFLLAVPPALLLALIMRQPTDGPARPGSMVPRQPAAGHLSTAESIATPSDGGSLDLAAPIADLATAPSPAPDLAAAATDPLSEPPPEPPRPRLTKPRPRYPLRLSGIERGNPEREPLWQCSDKSLNRDDRQLLAKVGALEVCWTSKRGWYVVTQVWIHNDRARTALEACLNAGLVLPMSVNPCFVISVEEER